VVKALYFCTTNLRLNRTGSYTYTNRWRQEWHSAETAQSTKTLT